VGNPGRLCFVTHAMPHKILKEEKPGSREPINLWTLFEKLHPSCSFVVAFKMWRAHGV